jgi:hypothetical protein
MASNLTLAPHVDLVTEVRDLCGVTLLAAAADAVARARRLLGALARP